MRTTTSTITLGCFLAFAGLAASTAIAGPPSSSKSSKTWNNSPKTNASKVKKITGNAKTLKALNPNAKVQLGKTVQLPPSDLDGAEAIKGPDLRKWTKHRLAQIADIDTSHVVAMTEIGIAEADHFWTSGTKVSTTWLDVDLIRPDLAAEETRKHNDLWEGMRLIVSASRLKPGTTLMLSCQLRLTSKMEAAGSASVIEPGGDATSLSEVTVESGTGADLTMLHVVATVPSGHDRLVFQVGANGQLLLKSGWWSYQPGSCVLSEIGG